MHTHAGIACVVCCSKCMRQLAIMFRKWCTSYNTMQLEKCRVRAV